MEGGNTSRIVIWLDDTVIVKKTLEGKAYYFIADARTGAGIPGAAVDFFGWRMVPQPGKNAPRENSLETRALSRKADDSGQLEVPAADLDQSNPHHQWLITATTPEGRLAHLGFTNFWYFGQGRDPAYDQMKIYTITDRPVYRPGAMCTSSSG